MGRGTWRSVTSCRNKNHGKLIADTFLESDTAANDVQEVYVPTAGLDQQTVRQWLTASRMGDVMQSSCTTVGIIRSVT